MGPIDADVTLSNVTRPAFATPAAATIVLIAAIFTKFFI
jgi:hypothetical protein